MFSYLNKIFNISLIIKGLNGASETIVGLLTLMTSQATINNLFFRAVKKELLEDPNDKLINFLAVHLTGISAGSKTFAAIYILGHGLLNIFLSIELYQKRHWAYLITIGVTVVFMLYQIYRFTHTQSTVLLALTIFDAAFVYLTIQKYKSLTNSKF